MLKRENKVKVYLRSRPCENFADDMIEFGIDGKTVNIFNRKKTNSQGYVNNQITDWCFKVDGILHNVSQDAVYENVVKDITLNVLDGYNGTVICYGQTGAGKTFTMTGATENYQQRGLIPRTIQHLFKEILKKSDRSYTIRIGYVEIYNEQLFDLLSLNSSDSSEYINNLAIYDDRGDVFIKGLNYHLVSSEEDALNLLFEGETNRSIGTHVLNKESSRSHCIFSIRIESKSISSSDEKYTLSKLNLVDLAGSERLTKTQSQGITQKEAQYINKSLSFLEQAVIGLTDFKKPFVQFRQSKLTHLLKDSIGGNCMTRMIANIWPEARHMEETVSTLRFASRMMNVSVEPAVNEIIDPMPNLKRMIQKLDGEVKTLKQELAMHNTLTNARNHSYEPLSEHQLFEIETQCRKYIEGSLDDIEITSVRQIKAVFSAFKRICKFIEKDFENRYKEKYNIIDKNDVELIGDSQKGVFSIGDDNSLVGDNDGQSFGIGMASKDLRANKSDLLKVTKKNRSKNSNKTGSPTLDSRVGNKISNIKEMNEHNKKDNFVSHQSNQTKDIQRIVTPPAKNIAFEEFKVERGNEINRIWNENKDILTSKKRQYSDLAHRINETKSQIDKTRTEVDKKRNERFTVQKGEFVNEIGETLIDEEEFSLIKKLQDLKSRYRDDFERWRELKAEIVYCQNLVEQCRQRLIQEFDIWYNEMYLNSTIYNSKDHIQDQIYGDENLLDKFGQTQRDAISSNLESIPYSMARNRIEKRNLYEKINEKSISFHSAKDNVSPSNENQYKLGTPLRKIPNPPPGKLTVS